MSRAKGLLAERMPDTELQRALQLLADLTLGLVWYDCWLCCWLYEMGSWSNLLQDVAGLKPLKLRGSEACEAEGTISPRSSRHECHFVLQRHSLACRHLTTCQGGNVVL